MTSKNHIFLASSDLLSSCRERSLKVSIAESCTGGLICAALTDLPGSSSMFDRGFITYTNKSKTDMLGVPSYLFSQFGAVSEEVACSMAEGAILQSNADLAVSVTGIAGPDGGVKGKPVGLVFFSIAQKNSVTHTFKHIFDGSRSNIRMSASIKAIEILLHESKKF